MEPDIQYARSEGASIAYQVVGKGGKDLVFVPDFGSNLVYAWESPYWRDFYELLARSFRLILWDKRGTGVSDRHGQFATLETRMEDMRAVLEAAGSTQAVVFGSHDGCDLAMLYAATYPDRTTALALFHPEVGPFEPEGADDALLGMREQWGTQAFMDEILQSTCKTLFERGEQDRLWFANWLRVSLSPEFAYALNRAFMESDLRPVLSAVRAPTIVLYRPGSVSEELHLEVARRIEGASAVTVSAPTTGASSFRRRSSTRSSGSSPARRRRRFRAPCSRPSSSPTSSARRNGRPSSATTLGGRCSSATIRSYVGSSPASAGRKRTPQGTVSSRPSTGPRGRFRCAQAIAADVRQLGLELRAGVHTGECEVHDDKLARIAVSTGARVAAAAEAGEVLVSLRGIPGEWRLDAVREGE